jgi:transcriptional regulator with XRE-family HTH domain
MDQPALGKLIVQLRKAKGWTQEELVERCNVSVRTLQRIESGEATPRPYTVRSIFAALEYAAPINDSNDLPDIEGSVVSHRLEQAYKYLVDLFNLRTNTMRKISILATTITVLSFVLVTIYSDSNAQSPAEAKKSIELLDQKFVRWFNQAKTDSILTLYSEDACIQGSICGREFIKGYYQSMTGESRFTEFETHEIIVDGSSAMEKGKWSMILASGEEVSGKFMTEWKFLKGRWYIQKDFTSM